MKKILSLALVGVMMFSALPMAYAAEAGGNWAAGTNVTVVGDGGEYYVTVPASLEPGQQGTVRAYGKWASDETVKVWTEDTVEVTHQDTGAKTDVNVAFAGIESLGNDLEDMDVTAPISIDKGDIRFGEWKGVIEYNVEFEKAPKYTVTVSDSSWTASIDQETLNVTVVNAFWNSVDESSLAAPSDYTMTYNGNTVSVTSVGAAAFTFAYQGEGEYTFSSVIHGAAGDFPSNDVILTITKN